MESREKLSAALVRSHDWFTTWCANRQSAATFLGSTNVDGTSAYIDLTFAWALARLGNKAEAARFRHQGTQALLSQFDDQPPPAHLFLLQAYLLRVDEALAGRPHGSPFPEGVLQHLDARHLDAGQSSKERYVIYRLLAASRVLEPIDRMNPYWEHRRADEPDRNRLMELNDLRRRQEANAVCRELLRSGKLDEVEIISVAMALASRAGPACLSEILHDAHRATLASDPYSMQFGARALFLSANRGDVHHAELFAAYLRECWASLKQLQPADCRALSEYVRSVIKLNMQDDLRQLIEVGEQRLASNTALAGDGDDVARMRVRLPLIAGRLYLGDDVQPPAPQEIAELLSADPKQDHLWKVIPAYLDCLGAVSLEVAERSACELFLQMPWIGDALMTRSHYVLSDLLLAEAVVWPILDRVDTGATFKA